MQRIQRRRGFCKSKEKQIHIETKKTNILILQGKVKETAECRRGYKFILSGGYEVHVEPAS
jgi:hypothetical protein